MNKKILILRGDAQSGKALSFLLAGSGFQISSHTSAQEAVEAARQQRFDLAITDELVPENQQELSFVANLKEAQPSLPVVFIAKKQSLDTVISCIRAGVSEIISSGDEMRRVFECARDFLVKGDDRYDVTWEDMMEVERALASLSGGGVAGLPALASGPGDPAQVAEMKRKLEEIHKERDGLAKQLADSVDQCRRFQTLIDELKAGDSSVSTDSEIAARAEALDKREESLNQVAQKIARQKAEVETALAELEAQRFELEDARKEAGARGSSDVDDSEALEALKATFDEERTHFNESRLDLEARIQDLERALAMSRSNEGISAEDKERLQRLSEELQNAREKIAEQDYTIQTQAKRLAAAESGEVQDDAAVQALEDEKRLLEIEKFKLQEKLDRLEADRSEIEKEHAKLQREIQVERRDAEVSLRELQNKIKEEQLKLKVEQATFKEEMRQYDQARQNFQEDVQDLQQKQAELRKLEAYLRQMESSIGKRESNALPEGEAPEPELRNALLEEDLNYSSASPAAAAPEAPDGAGAAKPNAKPGKPETWSKPDFDKKSGRGPLRIGRRSSF